MSWAAGAGRRRPGRMTFASWRAALRIAAREARRARGRSALVVAMIALPVLALSFAAVSYDMFTLTPAEQLDRRLGAADARLTWVTNGPVLQDAAGQGWAEEHPVREPGGPRGEDESPTGAEVTALLPPGSRATPLDSTIVRLDSGTASRRMSVRRLDPTDPMTRGLVRLRSGRYPAAATELALTGKAARKLGVDVGDRVGFEGGVEHSVVGLIEFPDDLGVTALAVPTGPGPAQSWLVDVPGDVDWSLVRRINRHGLLVTARTVVLDPPSADTPSLLSDAFAEGGQQGGVNVSILASGLGLLEVVLLAGPAFAVGARRRQRDLALVAANGGTLAQLRRIVLADGVVLGLIGAAAGTVLGVAVAVAGRPLVEQFVAGSRAGGYRFYPLALLVIAGLAVIAGILACLVPAYAAARQDVVRALTGRRGVVRSRRRWLVTGLLLAAAGGATAAYGAAQVVSDRVLFGLALGEIGLVLCTPSLVGLVARVGQVLPPAPRIALRDTARNRAAAAPAISAVMAAVAGSVALGTYFVSDHARAESMRTPAIPLGYASVSYERPAPDLVAVPVDRVAEAAAGAGLDVTATALISEPGCPAESPRDSYCGLDAQIPPERLCPFSVGKVLSDRQRRQALADPRCEEKVHTYYAAVASTVVDDGTILPLLTGADGADLARARATLAAGGVVVTDPRQLRGDTIVVEIHRSTDHADPAGPSTIDLPGYLLTTGLPVPRVIYSPAALARTGLTSQAWGYVLATGTTPTPDQQKRFRDAVRELTPGLSVEIELGAQPVRQPELIILALAAGVITVGAAGIATGLAAADGRADLTTLAAVGASPRMRRLLSLSQAGVIAGLGSLLGILAGLGAGFAVLAALNQGYANIWPKPPPYPLTAPWSTLAVLVVVPLVAMLGAGLLTRSRLPVERRRD